jgi:RNA polymerase sigma-70 factor (ECF subfamily)
LSGVDNQNFVAGMAAKYGGRLRRFLKLRLGNASDVPDLAQEVFLRLLRVPNHEEIRSPEAYLFTVASHVVQQHYQKQVATPASLDWVDQFADSPGPATDDPPAQVEVRQRLEHLERTLDQLPPRVAMALIMHRMAGHTIAEIARELNLAEITVKKYLARGLVHCRLAGPDPDSRASRPADADVVTLKRGAKP